MQAVWTFWTKPFAQQKGNGWLSDRHHLLAWVLSVETARKHYPRTTLVTDEAGAELLVHGLGLEFAGVCTELSALADEDPQWWGLGKLWTYRLQAEPFIHIDSDVFLWNRLPLEMETAPVFAQNPECFPLSPDSWYRITPVTDALREAGGWIPEEWRDAAGRPFTSAVNCGILGGNNLLFLRYYADIAIRMLRHPRNRTIWQEGGANTADNVLFEQYLLAACLDYHGVAARYLFASMAESFDEAAAARVGYTHLIGGAKRNQELMRALENRVRREYPSQYERCCRMDAATVRAAGR